MTYTLDRRSSGQQRTWLRPRSVMLAPRLNGDSSDVARISSADNGGPTSASFDLELCATNPNCKPSGCNLWGGASPVGAFDSLNARDLVVATGHVTPPPSREFWDEIALQAACDALPLVEERPELVVVDEAQDLEPSDWLLVEALVGDRNLWAFADPRQQFWRGREVPTRLFASAARLRLKQQHRNPPDLAAFALGYVDEAQVRKRPDPAVLRLSVARDRDVLERVRHELDVLRKEGARPEDITVLSLAGREKSKLVGLDRIGSHRVALADAPDAPERTIVDTFLRFKGLDRPIVIISELVQGATMRYETRMHIALTRAAVSAVIVCDDAAVEGDPRLQLLR